MSENGYFSLPRSLTRDSLWIDLPPAYRDVFIAILDHVCFKPQRFDDHGVVIDLKPGQVCASLREIVKWCGKWACKNEIERAIKKFILYGFLRQEVRHTKSIITISHKATYELIIKRSETSSETKLRQDGDNFETEKNNENNEKNEDIIIPDDLAVVENDENLSSRPDNLLKINGNSQIIDTKDVNSSVETSDNICYVLDSKGLTEKSHHKSQAKKARVKIKPSEEALSLLSYFNESLTKHITEVTNLPKNTEAKHFESILEHHPPDKIKEVIDFSHKDNFWAAIIHSPNDLKKKFSKLLFQKNNQHKEKTWKTNKQRKNNQSHAEMISNYKSPRDKDKSTENVSLVPAFRDYLYQSGLKVD